MAKRHSTESEWLKISMNFVRRESPGTELNLFALGLLSVLGLAQAQDYRIAPLTPPAAEFTPITADYNYGYGTRQVLETHSDGRIETRTHMAAEVDDELEVEDYRAFEDDWGDDE